MTINKMCGQNVKALFHLFVCVRVGGGVVIIVMSGRKFLIRTHVLRSDGHLDSECGEREREENSVAIECEENRGLSIL